MDETSLDLLFFFLHKLNTLITRNQKVVFKELAQVTFIIHRSMNNTLP